MPESSSALSLGAAYYPEQVPSAYWATDAALMQRSGLRTVRMGEHTWALLEPQPGHYDFSLLDESLRVLGEHEMVALLGVPSACPPQWMFQEYSDLNFVESSGLQRYPGSRHTHCPNHAGLRERARALTAALAEHLRDHPAVIGWQIDNELSISDSHRCYCDSCALHFRDWLRQRYIDADGRPSLDVLNAAWGTSFWSQRYNAWDEIQLPRHTTHPHNPGLVLNFARFASDQAAVFVAEHTALLRAANPRWFLTHNLWEGAFERLDLAALATTLDALAADAYPRYQPEPNSQAVAFHYAMTRRAGTPFWVTELQAMSALNFQAPSLTSRPGELRLWAWQALAHGAQRVLFFPWRSARSGGETFWQGLLGHDGRPNRFLAEVQRASAELAELAPIFQATWLHAQVALLYDWPSCAALDSHLTLHPHVRYRAVLEETYRALSRSGLTCDIVTLADNLARYRLLIAPMLYMVNDQIAAQLEQFVADGGTLVLTFRSGIVDADATAYELAPPGPLAKLCGLTVHEYGPIAAPQPESLQLKLGAEQVRCAAHGWYDLLALDEAQPLDHYTAEYYAGDVAAAQRTIGSGRVIYCGTLPELEIWERWLGSIAQEAGVQPLLESPPPGVEVVERVDDERRYLVLLNHSSTPIEIAIGGCTCLLGSYAQDRLRLAPYGVAILREEPRTKNPEQTK